MNKTVKLWTPNGIWMELEIPNVQSNKCTNEPIFDTDFDTENEIKEIKPTQQDYDFVDSCFDFTGIDRD